MKIAVISFDQLMKKAKPLLEGEGFDVTYFIVKPEQNINFENFAGIPISVSRLMIPPQEKIQTPRQAEVFKSLNSTYQEMRSRLTDSKTEFNDLEAVSIAPSNTDRKFDQVMDIYFDAKSKQVLFEIQNKGVEPYDLLICEGHSLITDELNRKSIQIKQKNYIPKYAWASFGFKYELLKPLAPRPESKSFFLVSDIMRDSIIDNWFLCQQTENHINFWSYYPESQMNNPEYQDFYIERLRNLTSKHLPFLQLKSFDSSIRSTVDFEPWSDSKMNLKNQIVFVPNMAFWSQGQIQKLFIQPLVKSLKKLKTNNGASV